MRTPELDELDDCMDALKYLEESMYRPTLWQKIINRIKRLWQKTI